MDTVKSKATGKGSWFSTVNIVFLITGNLIGVGILGLPILTGMAGFIPSLATMLVFGSAMFYSAFILSRESTETKTDTFNLPSLYKKYLGHFGKWMAVITNMLILYGLLTAYLSGGATIVAELFGIHHYYGLILLLFFASMTIITVFGIEVICRYNNFFVVFMCLAFVVIVLIAEFHVKPANLAHINWKLVPISVPVVVCAFHFHNIIPDVCKALDWNLPRICKVMAIAVITGYFMNTMWVQSGIGTLPLHGQNSIAAALQNNLPATIPMANLINSPVFLIGAMLFALLAIITSYVSNGMGLMSFNRDLLVNFFKISASWPNFLITFIPPLLIAYFCSDIFLKAINVVGGVGIVTLFGILPSIISFVRAKKNKWRRLVAIAMFCLFFTALIFELAETFGLIHWPTEPGAATQPQPVLLEDKE